MGQCMRTSAQGIDPVNVVIADPAKRQSVYRRLHASLIQRPNGCLEWSGKAVTHAGYGLLSAGRGIILRAHRVAWALENGPIPAGKFICHTCDNVKCCDHTHLWPGTARENTSDALDKGRLKAPPIHRGELHHLSVLSDAEVLRVREDTRPSELVGTLYGVSGRTIRRLRTGVSRCK